MQTTDLNNENTTDTLENNHIDDNQNADMEIEKKAINQLLSIEEENSNELNEKETSQEETSSEVKNIEIESANTTNCLALTIQKDHKIVAIKNVVFHSIKVTWKVIVSTIVLTIIKLLS